jgi:RNA polymerase sigma-70 factor (ECF subfamily)
MATEDPSQPLNRISTLWTVVCRAHEGTAGSAAAAQQVLLQRYSGAVYRYLLGALRDRDAAEDLAQEFALRFLQGKFRGVDPEHGRFRDFVKGVLCHLVADYHRRRPPPLPLADAGREPAAPAEPPADPDHGFVDSWREELLARVWEALKRIQDQTGQPFYAVLRFRADHPELRSAQMAEQLGAQLGKPITAPAVRQTLHRARDKFADLLLEEVAQTLREPTADALEQELLDLGLLEYCRPALDRYSGKA